MADREGATRTVPTTAGDVDVSALGRTMAHEHLRVGAEGLRAQWPHLFDPEQEFRDCVAKVREVQSYGVATICDPACMDLNRDVHLNIAVTEATGMRFVMATGVYGTHWASLSVFLREKLDLLVECFLHDLQVGIQGADVRAGFIKCAADFPGLTADVEMVHRATARAAVEAGVSVMAHSHPDSDVAFEQLRLFESEGLSPERVQIAHAGDTADLDYLDRLLDTGCYIGMDRYGLHLPTDDRNRTVAALVQRGHAERMMLGHDSCIVMDGRSEQVRLERAPDNHLTFLFESVLPDLLSRGVDQRDLDAMLGINVHAWLTNADRALLAPASSGATA